MTSIELPSAKGRHEERSWLTLALRRSDRKIQELRARAKKHKYELTTKRMHLDIGWIDIDRSRNYFPMGNLLLLRVATRR